MAKIAHDAHPPRRAFLLGAAAAAAIPTAGAMASGPPGSDAGLLALKPEIDAADQAWEVLHLKYTAAEEACWALKPDKPEEPCMPKAVAEAFEAGNYDALIEAYEASKSSDTDYGEALKVWREATERSERDSGYTAADEAVNAAGVVRLAIRDEKIIPVRATTINGLIFKARYAADHFPGDYDAEMMISIVDDLLAMAGEAAA